MTIIIGLTGYSGSGKTTAARYLEYRYGFRIVSFAKPIRDMLHALGVRYGDLFGRRRNEPLEVLGGKTPREAMQTLGTEWGRQLIHSDLWLHAWQKKAMSMGRVVADDLRFPNEAEVVRNLGGQVWLIKRNGTHKMPHNSEGAIDGIDPDAVFKDHETVRDLEDALDAAWALRIAPLDNRPLPGSDSAHE